MTAFWKSVLLFEAKKNRVTLKGNLAKGLMETEKEQRVETTASLPSSATGSWAMEREGLYLIPAQRDKKIGLKFI